MKVTVYSIPDCPWCYKAKDYLEYKEIRFKDIDVSKDIDSAREMIAVSGQKGVPVIKIDENVVIGFDKDMINQVLSLLKL